MSGDFREVVLHDDAAGRVAPTVTADGTSAVTEHQGLDFEIPQNFTLILLHGSEILKMHKKRKR